MVHAYHSRRTPDKNFKRGILFSILERSSNYVFGDVNLPTVLQARTVVGFHVENLPPGGKFLGWTFLRKFETVGFDRIPIRNSLNLSYFLFANWSSHVNLFRGNGPKWIFSRFRFPRKYFHGRGDFWSDWKYNQKLKSYSYGSMLRTIFPGNYMVGGVYFTWK